MILAKEIQDRINALRSNNTSGASTLTQSAAEILARVGDLSSTSSSAEVRSRVVAAGRALLKAQPAMAAVYTLVNAVLGELAVADADADLGRRVRERASMFSDALKKATELAAKRAASLVSDGMVVVTHSRSSIVEKALKIAHQSGKTFSVVCTESRPMGEGRDLAENLGAEGLSTTVVIDAAAPSFIAADTRVMVGADALSIHGLVNKIGTRIVAQAASDAGAAFYVVATTQRFLPPSVPLSYQAIKDPREILTSRHTHTGAVNLYFDHTPLDLVTACVTEEEMLYRSALLERLAAWTVREAIDLQACG